MQRLGASVQRQAESVERLRDTMQRLEEADQDAVEALDRHDEIIQALLAFVPLTQAEIVRLDNRIDSIEGA